MDANALTPWDVFSQIVNYEIPPFQRPYVWTEEDQWQPLWEDVERLADDILDASDLASDAAPRTHFLGAVVLKQVKNSAGDPVRRSVIDGQQRLTTLQILLDAAQEVTEAFGAPDDAEALQELVTNASKRFAKTPKRFKLWPCRYDRVAFEHVMDNALTVPPELSDSRIAQAHAFFKSEIERWADVTGDPDKCVARMAALSDALQRRLQLVTIDLGEHDDDQLIFETLNDRGTPLLSADLIKNYVFQRCEDLGIDVDDWNARYWQDFDSDWWRGQVAQGRLYRSRIDLFLQYWLTMRLLAEIPTDSMFARFKAHASEHLADAATAEHFLQDLRLDADTFSSFADASSDSATGRFYSRVVEALELGAFMPLLLWVHRADRPLPAASAEAALTAAESWAVRRTLLRYTSKGINKLVVALLAKIQEVPVEAAGEAAVAFLAEQTSDATEWPTDAVVVEALPRIKVYGNIKQHRLRTVLGAIEIHLRTERHGNVTLPDRLEIEHIMPRGWREHWGTGVADDAELAARRDALINTIGNLTLVTKKLNIALSNRPWTDAEAAVVAPTGKDAGRGKRSMLNEYNLLVLNKDIVDDHDEAWTDADISARSTEIARAVTLVWRRPEPGLTSKAAGA